MAVPCSISQHPNRPSLHARIPFRNLANHYTSTPLAPQLHCNKLRKSGGQWPRPAPHHQQSYSYSTLTRNAHLFLSALPPNSPGGPGTSVNKGFSLLEWTNGMLPQGQLVSGVQAGWRLTWQAMVRELAPQSRGGAYSRPQYSFSGVVGQPGWPSESARYHLYLGNACPWCHRVAVAAVLRGAFREARTQQQQQQQGVENGQVEGAGGAVAAAAAGEGGRAAAQQRNVPGLQQRQQQQRRMHVGLTWLEDDPTRARRGGWVLGARDPDPVFGARDLWEVYDRCQPGFRGRCTAPLLVDTVRQAAVCNE
ncbi:hypothetical protein Agub_g3625, partial [Astrephomene gubernaculifera]